MPLTGKELDEELENYTQELHLSNDISYDGVDPDTALNYNPSFGKICTGE